MLRRNLYFNLERRFTDRDYLYDQKCKNKSRQWQSLTNIYINIQMATTFSFMNIHTLPSAIRFFIRVFLTLMEIPINAGRQDIHIEKNTYKIWHDWLKRISVMFSTDYRHLCGKVVTGSFEFLFHILFGLAGSIGVWLSNLGPVRLCWGWGRAGQTKMVHP